MKKRMPLVLSASLIIAIIHEPLAAAIIRGRNDPHRVRDQYIVVLKDPRPQPNDRARFVDETVDSIMAQEKGKVLFRFSATITGFAIRSKDEQKVSRIAEDPRVSFVEVDRPVRLFDDNSGKQTDAPWGLARISARSPGEETYYYGTTASNVNAYIIDTGVRGTHTEFTGRIGDGFSVTKDTDPYEDCNGHGTHVAGTIGGKTYGVAKKVRLHAVRVMNCSGEGSYAGVIAGVDWVAQHAVKPAVANISLGGKKSAALDEAVRRAIASGVVFVVAAGNDGANACDYSPADVPTAITVGATMSVDFRANFSNKGKCVKIFAPGDEIESSWSTGDTDTNSISGTSMASPHVAGAVALFLAQDPDADPAAITKIALDMATRDVLKDVGDDSPNLIIYTNPHGASP